MKAFPKSSPRKEIKVNLFARDSSRQNALREYSIKGVQVGPLVIHRALENVDTGEYSKKEWVVTHVHTGYSIGISGKYRFCKAVADHLVVEPVLWMLSLEMMRDHPDYNDMASKVFTLKDKYRDLR